MNGVTDGDLSRWEYLLARLWKSSIQTLLAAHHMSHQTERLNADARSGKVAL